MFKKKDKLNHGSFFDEPNEISLESRGWHILEVGSPGVATDKKEDQWA